MTWLRHHLPRLRRYALVGLVGGVLLFFTWQTFESFNTPKEALLKIGTTLLVGAIMLGWVVCGIVFLPVGPLVWGAGLFWGWGMLSLAFSPNPVLTLRAQLFSLCFLLLFLMVPMLLRERDDPVKFWRAVCTVGGLVALIGVAQSFGVDYEHGLRLLTLSEPIAKIEIYSTIGNPNYMAAVLAFLLPIMLAMAAVVDRTANAEGVAVGQGRWSVAEWWLLRFCALLAGVAILLSGSKGGVLAAVSGVVSLLIIRGWWERWPFRRSLSYGLRWGGLALFGLLIMIWWLPDAPLVKEVKNVSRFSWEAPTIKGRLLIWKSAAEMIADHPLRGIGVGTFGAQYQPYRALVFERLDDPAAVYPASEPSYNETLHAHNDYLQITAERGMIGAAIFLGWVGIGFATGWRLLRAISPARGRYDGSQGVPVPPAAGLLISGLLAGIVALLVHAATDAPLEQPASSLLFWVAMGSLLTISVLVSREGASHPSAMGVFGHRLIRWPRPAKAAYDIKIMYYQLVKVFLGIAIVIVAIFMISLAVRPVIASTYHRRAWYFMQHERWAPALIIARLGLEWDPWSADLILYSGVASYHLGNLERSKADFLRYHSLYSDFQTLYNLGLLEVREGHTGAAEAYFREALRYKPTSPEVAVALARIAALPGGSAGLRQQGQGTDFDGP